MIPDQQLDILLKNALSNLNVTQQDKDNKKDSEKNNCPSLTPTQILVILGLLSGALDALSINVDRDQNIEIVLQGSLKQKTQLEKTMDIIGALPFDEVLKAMLGRI